ncbi:hypothetical protein ACUY1T_03065 [Billgrantia sp. Q4P2]|uniref:hypothetical protein n=1 Tax=Billgrantia sp. Q4P2 TaxID=3463857 RepID=UPI0040561659
MHGYSCLVGIGQLILFLRVMAVTGIARGQDAGVEPTASDKDITTIVSAGRKKTLAVSAGSKKTLAWPEKLDLGQLNAGFFQAPLKCFCSPPIFPIRLVAPCFQELA